jgi:hypothetical protein
MLAGEPSASRLARSRRDPKVGETRLQETKIVKKPKWLKWQSGEKSSVSKSENLKNVRRQTDQKLKQQDAQKERRDEAEKKNQSP